MISFERHREFIESFRGKELPFFFASGIFFLVTGEFYREVVWMQGYSYDGFLIEILGAGALLLLPVSLFFLIHFLAFSAVFFGLLTFGLRSGDVEPTWWDKKLVGFLLLAAGYVLVSWTLILLLTLISGFVAANHVYIDSFIPAYVLEEILWYGPVVLAAVASFLSCLNSSLLRRKTMGYSFIALLTGCSAFFLLRACVVIAYAI